MSKHWVHKCLALILVIGFLTTCISPPSDPTVPISPLRLPTRVPPTLTPTPDVRGYYEEGLAYQQTGDTEAALWAFTQVIELAPDFAPAYVARGGVHLARGEYALALADADAALKADPTNAAAYALRGETLRLMDKPAQALEAFDAAVTRDPRLKAATFHSRWLAACVTRSVPHLKALSQEYTLKHPNDPMGHYYRGWALVEERDPTAAISTLIQGIESASQPPALLWFALGQAYAAAYAWQEAVVSLETARRLAQSGDASLALHTDRPIADLFGALGRAYLGAGRCAEAQAALEYTRDLGVWTLEYANMLQEARICQTPTPTPTRYPTVTPPAGD